MEKFLHKIDTLFKNQSARDLGMIYIMIFGAIFAFAYTLFWDSSANQFKQKQKDIEMLKSKINLDRIFLNINTPSKLQQLKNDIKKTDKEIIVYKEYNEYIKQKIEAISSLKYDKVIWGKYLYSISTNAKKNGVKILHFTNKFADKKNAFGHILDISIQSTGSYTNTMKFINSLEQSDLVVDIHTINIKAKERLYSDLNLSVWGISY
jgi:Tfp pilus assembly protein PilO